MAGFRTPRAFPRGSAGNIDTANLEQNLYQISLTTDTIDVRAFGGTDDIAISATMEQMVTAAIQYAKAVGASKVFVPKSMESFNVALVTLDNAVRIVTESQVTGGSSRIGAVTFSATPTFNAGLYDTFEITITANVTSSTLINAKPGMQLIWRIIQSGGPFTFAWPTNVKGGGVVGSGSNVQVFEVGLDNNAYAVAAMQTGM